MAVLLTIPQQFRQDTFTSAQVTAPSDPQPLGTMLQLRGDVAVANVTDPANTMAFSLWVFDEPVGAFRFDGGITWQGNAGGFQPQFAIPYADIQGKTVRFEWSIPVRIRIGGVIETVAADA